MTKKFVSAVDIRGKIYKISVDKLKWRPSAYGIILKKDKVLLSKQFNGYDLPGGGINLGEAPDDAVVREIKEETGIEAANPKLITIASSYFVQTYKSPKQAVQTLHLYYRCDVVGGKLSMDGFDEHEKEYADMPEWLPVSQLNTIEVENNFDWREIVKQVYENSRH